MTAVTEGPTTPERAAGSPLWVRGLVRAVTVGWGLAAILTAVMGIMIILDVVLRNVGTRSFDGTADMTSYWWMPGITFLTMGIVHMRNEQIRVTLLTESASPQTVRRSELVIEILLLVLVAWFAWLQSTALAHSWRIGEHALGATWVVVWPGRAVVVIGLLLLLAGVALRIYTLSTGRPLPVRPEPTIGEPDAV